jgi:hypothetical protein
MNLLPFEVFRQNQHCYRNARRTVCLSDYDDSLFGFGQSLPLNGRAGLISFWLSLLRAHIIEPSISTYGTSVCETGGRVRSVIPSSPFNDSDT